MSSQSQQKATEIVQVLFGEGRHFSFRKEENARDDNGLKGFPILAICLRMENTLPASR